MKFLAMSLIVLIFCLPTYAEILVYKTRASGTNTDFEDRTVQKEKISGYLVMEVDLADTDITVIDAHEVCYGKFDGRKEQWLEDMSNMEFKLVDIGNKKQVVMKIFDDIGGAYKIGCGKSKATEIGAGEKKSVAKNLKGHCIWYLENEDAGSGTYKCKLDTKTTTGANLSAESASNLVISYSTMLAIKGYLKQYTFDANSDIFTNPWLGLTNINDSYSLAGYGIFAGTTRSYSLIGSENVMGVDCLIMRVLGHGENPAAEYYDPRIAQDTEGNIHVLKFTGDDGHGNPIFWQASSPASSPVFLPYDPQPGQYFPFVNQEYHEVIALNQTVPLMSTGAGPYIGCMQQIWGDKSSKDTDIKYCCPGIGFVKEVWNDDGELNGWERIP